MIQENITGYFNPNESKILESDFIIRNKISRTISECLKTEEVSNSQY